MAQIQSNLQTIEIDVDGGTSYKSLVCVSTGSLEGSADSTTEDTDCGSFTSVGSVTYTINADAICETAPTVSQVTYQDLLPKFNSKSLISVRWQNPVIGVTSAGSVYFHEFKAFITSLTMNKPSASGYVSFSVTLESSGAIDITA
jgi:hypothetical protein